MTTNAHRMQDAAGSWQMAVPTLSGRLLIRSLERHNNTVVPPPDKGEREGALLDTEDGSGPVTHTARDVDVPHNRRSGALKRRYTPRAFYMLCSHF